MLQKFSLVCLGFRFRTKALTPLVKGVSYLSLPIAIIGFCMLGTSVHAQRGWEAGAGLGAVNYFGDLNTNYRFTDVGPAGIAFGRFNFNDRISLRVSGLYGTVQAYDSKSDNAFEQARNLSFKSNIIEGLAQVEFNFLPYLHGSENHFFTPYMFGGLGFTHYEPMAEFNNEWVELRPLGTEGQFKGSEYYALTAGLAYGMGFKVDLNYYWSLNLEFGGRSLATDYLDDVSTVYPDQSDLIKQRGELAAQLSNRADPESEFNIGEKGRQRGNSSNRDSYVTGTLSVVYYFGKLACPSTAGSRRR